MQTLQKEAVKVTRKTWRRVARHDSAAHSHESYLKDPKKSRARNRESYMKDPEKSCAIGVGSKSWLGG